MKIISIVGTRPQFIKVSILDKELDKHNIEHIIINTGQHYDKEMSDDIFRILFKNIPKYNLNKTGTTNIQTLSNMMNAIDEILISSIILLLFDKNFIIVFEETLNILKNILGIFSGCFSSTLRNTLSKN